MILPSFPAPLARVIHFVVIWLLYLTLATLVALALTRIYLIVKVNKISRKEFTIYIPQPTDFVQLDHERNFKWVLGGLLSSTAISVLSALVLTHLFETGSNIREDIDRK